ncbi:hypothetical protein, partial [Pseudomonas urmiensis]|uniref:hypothetical protein n=1 Tax=Pseudomonas urmiensis TaxID=2745493 RepID=UPI003D133B33
SILDDADAPAVRDTIGAQAANANLEALAGLTLAADQMLLATGASSLTTLATTAYGQSLLALANAAAARTTLQLGQVATDNVVPLARGGTGATSIESARSNLGLKTAALADIVGPVSQSVGKPSGAIIERGSNASGEYVRYADGTQICWGQVTANASITSAIMGAFRSSAVNVPFPVGFSETPRLTPIPYEIDSCLSCIVSSNTNANGGSILLVADAPQTAASRVVTWLAIGRWY